MKNISFILFCLVFCSCKAQNIETNSDVLLGKIYKNQLKYFSTKIVDKDNYVSIINFSGQERTKILKQTRGLFNSDSLYIIEGFSPAWGNYVGLIWNNNVAYSYKKSSTDKNFHVSKINFSDDKVTRTGIEPYIIDRIKRWDLTYINGLKNELGMSVSDGFNFISTRVTNVKGENPLIETISFEEFVNEI